MEYHTPYNCNTGHKLNFGLKITSLGSNREPPTSLIEITDFQKIRGAYAQNFCRQRPAETEKSSASRMVPKQLLNFVSFKWYRI